MAEFIGETNFLAGKIVGIEAEKLQIATEVGPLTAARPENSVWQENQEVWCSIRPESWRLNDKKVGNNLAAQIEDAMYLGQNEQLLARLTGGRENAPLVKAAIANPGGAAPILGGQTTLGCAPEDVVVLAS